MNFSEQFNTYIQTLQCTAKELSEISGISAATLSRYRSGERVPEANSEAFEKLCEAIYTIAQTKAASTQATSLSAASIKESFFKCSDMATIDKEQLRLNFNTLISLLNINISRLCQKTNYDSSTIFRFRNGSRQPSEPVKFAAAVAGYVAREMNTATDIEVLAKLFECDVDTLSDTAIRFEKIQNRLLEGQTQQENHILNFLTKLDTFDLNEYIKTIHFNELKLPPAMPFRLPTSKTYFGLHDMMESEIDFLKATVLSKSMEPVIMYSDMPMGEMAKDPEFPKKWMFGMAMMLKKGLHLHQIHNLDRSFEDMMLGLESWIPMYMTGQVSPYYLKGVQNNVFLHFLKVSGTVALSGEAISGHHNDSKYYLAKSKDEVAYYQKRAKQLLNATNPLMEIYRVENAAAFDAFLHSANQVKGARRNILSAPPIYTMSEAFLKTFLENHNVPQEAQQHILTYADTQRRMAQDILAHSTIHDELSVPTKEEFEHYPVALSLSGMFYETDITYTWEEFQQHLAQTRAYANDCAHYDFSETSSHAFRNLQIYMHEGKWAMISKNKAPAIILSSTIQN